MKSNSCCKFCTSNIRPTGTLPPESSSVHPFALAYLLPAGAIQIRLRQPHDICNHFLAEDGWHHFPADSVLTQLEDVQLDYSTVKELSFLVKHSFIVATCCLTSIPLILCVRIYVVPYDLAGVQGRLRIRDHVTVLKPARPSLRALLQRTLQDSCLWDGRGSPSSENPRPILPHDIDNRTMAEIYGDLPFPDSGCHNEINGMRSTLFKYQRQSVLAMIQKETAHLLVPDPLFIPLVGMNGHQFYLQPATMEILRDRPMIQRNRGGVLCEELGTGKTVMILALVLATLDQLSSPEDSLLDTHPVMTPLSFRSFSSSDCRTARRRAARGKITPFVPKHPQIPTFVELLLHKIRVSPRIWDLHDYAESLEGQRLWSLQSANTPFYHHYNVQHLDTVRTKRNQSDPGPRTMYLTTASLIIVPDHLMAQWRSEILKHTQDGALRVLVLARKTDTQKFEMPVARLIASQYDIVLISHQRFAAEEDKKDVAKLYSWNVCKCPEFPGTRVPDCQCGGYQTVSPLFQIRWKRVVIDEGHVAANEDSRLTSLATLLSIERRWVVTGTPTTNLLGLSFGKNSEAQDTELLQVDPQRHLFMDGQCDEAQSDDFQDAKVRRTWKQYDREDLRKFAKMIIHFLDVPRFAGQPEVFNTEVIDPLFRPLGPQAGAIQVLEQVMQMQMIRHRIEDVEVEVALPRVMQEEILLDLDPLAVKSYNAHQASIAINAIDSERVDQDYLFHPKNAKALSETIANISQLLFWSVSDTCYNVEQLSRDFEKHVKTACQRGVSSEDLDLLMQCKLHLQTAVEDDLWRAIQTDVHVSYLLSDLPSHRLFNAWTRTNTPPAGPSDRIIGYMHLDRLEKMRQSVLDRPLMSEHRVVELGRLTSELDRLLAARERAKTNKSLSEGATTKFNTKLSLAGKKKAQASANEMTSPSKVKEMQYEQRVAEERQKFETEEANSTSTHGVRYNNFLPPSLSSEKASVLSSSPLARIRVGSSTSSKLNYILNEVLTYATEEKLLIFSQHPLSLAHIADGLKLISVAYLQLTSQVDVRRRERLAEIFETSDLYRVLLIDLKYGARGLNLVSASRVIFCEPVWQADVESQAIKRAHRIGQTHAINVKTLVIRSTAEEAMIARKRALKGTAGKLPILEQEAGMRHFIANPKFLQNSKAAHLPTLEFPLINLLGTAGTSESSPVVVSHEPESLAQSSRKRRKEVKLFQNEAYGTSAASSFMDTSFLQESHLSNDGTLGEALDDSDDRPASPMGRVTFSVDNGRHTRF